MEGTPMPITTCAEALAALGVTDGTLTREQREQLDRDGFFVIEQAIPRDLAQRIATRLDQIAADEGDDAGKDFQTEGGATRLGALVNKDPVFDVCFLDRRGLAAVDHVTRGDFGLSSITGRAAQPGAGGQELHADFMQEVAPGVWRRGDGRGANVLWALDDFTPLNGPTRIVPGSHRFETTPAEVMDDPQAPHPDEIHLVVPAGSMAVIDGATWHGGTRNRTDRPRRLVSAFFTPRRAYQDYVGRWVSPAVRERYSDAAAFILDHPVREPGSAA
jgi:hypothetical protein